MGLTHPSIAGNDPSVLDSIVSLKASITQDRTKFDKQRECVIDLVSQVNDVCAQTYIALGADQQLTPSML